MTYLIIVVAILLYIFLRPRPYRADSYDTEWHRDNDIQ